MSDVTYAIVFSGEIVEGFQPISVKAHLAKMLKATPEKMKVLFSGKPVVLKRTQDKAEAAKYGGALKKVGANVRVKILKTPAATNTPAKSTQPSQPTTQNQPANTTSSSDSTRDSASANTPAIAEAPSTIVSAPANPNPDFSLAPNEGNLFEAAPEPEAPTIDLSGISIAENDGAPLVAPKSYEKANIDVSALSVTENDGSPLVEPSDEVVPKVNAPDFGLDAPGAVLETLKEDVEPVNPDTSGMSLAFPGSDLLNPEEKDQGPPPEAPDTSNLSIVREKAVF